MSGRQRRPTRSQGASPTSRRAKVQAKRGGAAESILALEQDCCIDVDDWVGCEAAFKQHEEQRRRRFIQKLKDSGDHDRLLAEFFPHEATQQEDAEPRPSRPTPAGTSRKQIQLEERDWADDEGDGRPKSPKRSSAERASSKASAAGKTVRSGEPAQPATPPAESAVNATSSSSPKPVTGHTSAPASPKPPAGAASPGAPDNIEMQPPSGPAKLINRNGAISSSAEADIAAGRQPSEGRSAEPARASEEPVFHTAQTHLSAATPPTPPKLDAPTDKTAQPNADTRPEAAQDGAKTSATSSKPLVIDDSDEELQKPEGTSHASSSKGPIKRIRSCSSDSDDDEPKAGSSTILRKNGKKDKEAIKKGESDRSEPRKPKGDGAVKNGNGSKAKQKDGREKKDKKDRKSKDSNKSKEQKQEKKENKARKRARREEKDLARELKSNLNADAYARSTGLAAQKKGFSSGLRKLQQARMGRSFSDDSDSDASDSDSESTSDSDSDAGSLGFIVDDDQVEAEDGRIRRIAPQPNSHSLALPMRRFTLNEACQEYMRWLVTKILDLSVDLEREKQLLRARKFLQTQVEDWLSPLTSSVSRRQFTWYLKHYPSLEKRDLFAGEMKHFTGCAACHRSSQKCSARIILRGRPYDRQSLEWLDPEEDAELSSDMSTDAEDAVEHQLQGNHQQVYDDRHGPTRKQHVFYLGTACAAKAEVRHELTHWEYQALQKTAKNHELRPFLDNSKPKTPDGDDIERIVMRAYLGLRARLLALQKRAIELSRAK